MQWTPPWLRGGNRDMPVSSGSYVFLSNSCGQGEEWLKTLNKGVWIPFTAGARATVPHPTSPLVRWDLLPPTGFFSLGRARTQHPVRRRSRGSDYSTEQWGGGFLNGQVYRLNLQGARLQSLTERYQRPYPFTCRGTQEEEEEDTVSSPGKSLLNKECGTQERGKASGYGPLGSIIWSWHAGAPWTESAIAGLSERFSQFHGPVQILPLDLTGPRGQQGARENMPENKQPVCRTSSQLSHSAYRKIKRVLSFRRRVFGQRLEETVVYERRYGERLAPLVVEQCVAFIRERGLLEVGLFRQPGQATLVKELQVAFDAGEKPSFDSNTDVHTVASLLKLYLRELPEPVVPFSRYQDFLLCGKGAPADRKQALEDLKKLLHELPVANFNLLHYICRFLKEVQSYSHINKMSTQNLATVFGPNILRPKAEDPESIIGGATLVQQLMTELIRECGSLFLRDASSAPGQDSLPRQGQRDDPSPQDSSPPPCRAEMEHRPPPRQTPSPRRVSDPLYDNCPSPTERRSAEPGAPPPPATPPPGPAAVPTLREAQNGCAPGSWDGPRWAGEKGDRGSGSSSSSQEGRVGRNAHESTLSVYDNLDVPAGVSDAPAPPGPRAPPEDGTNSGDSSSWSSCEIVLEEAKAITGPGFGQFPFRVEPPDPLPDFPAAPLSGGCGEAFLSPAAPEPDPCTSSGSLRYLLTGLKQQMARQKDEYEAQIRSLEQRNESLHGEVSSLRANLEQQRRWYKVVEIKMRNAERARADADRRNTALQQEMEQFFDTFGELNCEAKKTERIVQSF
ncbi:hypothetical protein AAFF_G00319770 [Aldrovandia affinis]|uniref:Rho-GAP domain-containing protein n=1 Tax=Aldrovandia affinis TaxID=143900 RepID=A0AAD7SMP4_9TELE|nr:hypothetical protein AAFF_G00319770 [Aldrovandia affinis]